MKKIVVFLVIFAIIAVCITFILINLKLSNSESNIDFLDKK